MFGGGGGLRNGPESLSPSRAAAPPRRDGRRAAARAAILRAVAHAALRGTNGRGCGPPRRLRRSYRRDSERSTAGPGARPPTPVAARISLQHPH